MKITSKQLKEMIRKAVREQLSEQAPVWGSQNTPKGLAGFAGKTSTQTFQSNAEKAKKTAAQKAAEKQAGTGEDFGSDKTLPKGKVGAANRKKLEQSKKLQNLKKQVYYEIDQASTDPEKLQAVLDYLRKDQAN